MKTKTCKDCGRRLPETKFQLSSPRKDGSRGRIGSCNACRWKQRKEAMKSWPKEKQRAETERWKRGARAWDKRNPHSMKARHCNLHAKRLCADGRLTMDDVTRVWNRWSGRCWVCGFPATEIDHVQPLNSNAGGTNTPDNIRPICRECNQKRSHKWHGIEVAKKEAMLLKQIKHILNGSDGTLQDFVWDSE